MKHGDLGARTTVVHARDKQIEYIGPDGRARLGPADNGQLLSVWDAEGKLVYEGSPDAVDSVHLSEPSLRLIQSILQAQQSMDLNLEKDEIEVKLTVETDEPLTFLDN